MGIAELLTVLFVALKLMGHIDWSWFYVLLPVIISFGFYAFLLIIWIVLMLMGVRAR